MGRRALNKQGSGPRLTLRIVGAVTIRGEVLALDARWRYGLGIMSTFDPIALDRSLRGAAEEAHEWRARLREEASLDDDPFTRYRNDLGRARFEEISALPADDPLKQPLLRWLWALIEQRINRVGLTQVAFLRYQDELPGTYPSGTRATVHDLLQSALASAGQRRAWLTAFFDQARPLSPLERQLWERRQEIAVRLGVDGPDDLELPAKATECRAFATKVRSALADSLEPWRRQAPHEWLEAPLAQKYAAALPTHLRESTLADWFREARLLEGLRLRPFELPKHLGVSSFLRALDALGGEFQWAIAPQTQPFVVAHDPFGLQERAMGACFASLLFNPSFIERQLALGRKNQTDFRRGVAVSMLLEIMARASKLALRSVALLDSGKLEAVQREQVAEWLGPVAPHAASLAWLRLRQDDAQRLCGAVLGLAHAVRLCEEHDEDWFRSPRAVERLRSEASRPPRAEVTADEFDAALDVVRAQLCAAL